MKKYKEILQQIEDDWESFIASERFFDEEENKIEKMKIKDFVEKVFENQALTKEDKKELIDDSVRLLGEHTGCAEDLMIADEIMGALIERKILEPKSYDIFFSKSPINRWL